MSKIISKIPNDIQDRNSLAWKKLCEYINEIAEKGTDEFIPVEALGQELFSQIYTLPKSIKKLKKVKKMGLYGSNLKRIPPEIGEMESLEFFDPYTSYELNWFPYEITKCKKLKDSRISTRALFGNVKNRKPFPLLNYNPVSYYKDKLKCSICEKEITHNETNQMWITLRIGTDTVPLLANLCSTKCEQELPTPAKGYVNKPHKGGADLKMPPPAEWKQGDRIQVIKKSEAKKILQKKKTENIKPLKLIKKIWGK